MKGMRREKGFRQVRQFCKAFVGNCQSYWVLIFRLLGGVDVVVEEKASCVGEICFARSYEELETRGKAEVRLVLER